jgi:hypothetical protein
VEKMKKILQSLVLASITITGVSQAELLEFYSDDLEKSLKGITKSCKNGDKTACELMKGIQDQSIKIVSSPKQLQSECDHNNFESCTVLGLKYFKGDGVKVNKSKTITLFTKACDNDFKEACTNLGMLYYYGDGVKEDKDKGIALLTKSCEDGDQFACDQKTTLESESKDELDIIGLSAAVGGEKASELFMDISMDNQTIQRIIEKVNKVKKTTGKKKLSDKEIDKIINEAKKR